MIQIKEASAEDLEQLLSLYSTVYGDEVLAEDESVRKIWNQVITNHLYHVIVAEENNKIISSCICVIVHNLACDHRPYAIVENLVTHSAFRAQGLATACLMEAQRIAESENCCQISLLTASKLPSTHKIYERLGYSKDDMTAFTKWLV